MKSTEAFKNVIKQHLEKKAAEDPLFTEKFRNEKKNIDDCVTYILNTVRASGCNGFEDAEIFGMAIHYYDEDKIDIGKKIFTGNMVINHLIELSDEEKNQARDRAKSKYESEQLQSIKKEEEKKAEKDRKRQEKAEQREEAKQAEREKRTAMAQQTLF